MAIRRRGQWVVAVCAEHRAWVGTKTSRPAVVDELVFVAGPPAFVNNEADTRSLRPVFCIFSEHGASGMAVRVQPAGRCRQPPVYECVSASLLLRDNKYSMRWWKVRVLLGGLKPPFCVTGSFSLKTSSNANLQNRRLIRLDKRCDVAN